MVEIGVAGIAIFAATAEGVHGVLEVDEDFEAVVLEARDGLVGHPQIFFRRGLEGLGDVEQTGLDDDDRNRDALLVARP